MRRRHIRIAYDVLDKKVANEAKYVYMALLRFRSGNSKNIKVSIAKLSEVTGLKGRQLTKHINTLIKYKVISRYQNKHNDGNYGCNTYSILCNEEYFSEIPWEIASNKELSKWSMIGYCIMKRFIDIDKEDFTCYLSKDQLATYLQCSINQVDKIKRNLKGAGLIDFDRNSNKVVLIYELALVGQLNSNLDHIKQVVRDKNKAIENESYQVII
ncbi:hypothetical protein [Dendrosporobacter sp. 1207_IL3150]|uniref:hypothetical protein n=1 Tax=Dendrosporobacter sp. 1207_IL3150 TaxID=3084054 RepID=UPI002FDB5EDF